MLASVSSEDKTMVIWNVATGESVGRPITISKQSLFTAAFNSKGKILALYDMDRDLSLWDIDSLRQGHGNEPLSVFRIYVDYNDDVNSPFKAYGELPLSFSHDSKKLAWSFSGARLGLAELETGKQSALRLPGILAAPLA